jgi:uncharacterized membrane protein
MRPSIERQPSRKSKLTRFFGVLPLLLVWLVIPALVFAQSTGGSFGGGDWSSGGNSGGSSGGDHEGLGWLLYMVVRVLFVTIGPIPTLIIVAIGAVFYFALRGRVSDRKMPLGKPPKAGSPLWNQVDITALHIALDFRARVYVERRFRELGRGADARRKEGLIVLVRALSQALDEARVAWLRAGVTNFHPMSPADAQKRFGELQTSARATQKTQTEGAEANEGAAVLTLLVAAQRELVDIRAHDANELALALSGLRDLRAHELVAADMVWSPAQQGARMSLQELEARHPELITIAEHSIGARVFCPQCRAPYPKTEGHCPSCRAPNPELGGAVWR